MKEKLIVFIFIFTLTLSCGSSKTSYNSYETKTEVKSGEDDPVMKLLASALVILTINFLATK